MICDNSAILLSAIFNLFFRSSENRCFLPEIEFLPCQKLLNITKKCLQKVTPLITESSLIDLLAKSPSSQPPKPYEPVLY